MILRVLLSGLLSIPLLVGAAVAGEAILGQPQRLDLYQDGGRLLHRIDLPIGVSRFILPHDIGTVVQVDGADAWHEEHRRDTIALLPLPAALPPMLEEANRLAARREAVDEREALAIRLADDIRARLPLRALDVAPEDAVWQSSIDALARLQQDLMQERLALDEATRDLRDRADAQRVANLSLGQVLGLEDATTATRPRTLEQLTRRWQALTEAVGNVRLLVVERRAVGAVTVLTERSDLGWQPQARLLVAGGKATLVRQARITVPDTVQLPAVAARLIAGGRSQPLTGVPLQLRRIEHDVAKVADRRSVQVTKRSADWQEVEDAEILDVGERVQSWTLARLALDGTTGAQVVELQSGAIDLLTDEWLLAPELRPVLARRLSLRLDARPLLGGPLDLVVDGSVLGRQTLATLAPATVLTLSGGEDQRIFVANRKNWDDDPNRPPNRKREGEQFTLRNLGDAPLRFTCYLTVPVSAAAELTRTVDPQTTAGWAEVHPGILRWTIDLKAGEERVLERGWVVEATGQVRL